MFLMFHNNAEFYTEFRHTVQDDQFTSVMMVQEKGFGQTMLFSLFNVMLDRLVFDTLDFYSRFPAFQAFVMSMVREEETAGLTRSLEEAMNRKALMDSIRVVRPDFLSVMMHFMLETSSEIQRDCLRLLRGLLKSKNCQLNLIAVTSQTKGLVDLLLDHMEEFEEENIELLLEVIECVAKHYITVQQLKMVFRLLHTHDGRRARYANQILAMLNSLYITADTSKPDHSFLLVPPTSGIKMVSAVRNQANQNGQLDGIMHFPQGGFAISLWFNLSGFMADWVNEGEFAVPHLLSIVDADNSFLVFIQNASLVIKCYQGGKETSLPDTNLPILENQWYHMVVSQNRNRAMKGQDTLIVSLNGVCNYDVKATYPCFSSNAHFFVGTRGVDMSYTPIPTAYTDFKGEIGNIYMFNRALDKSQSRALFLLGPNYMSNFENITVENRVSDQLLRLLPEDRAIVSSLCDGSLVPSVLINLSAFIMNKEHTCVVDSSPLKFRAQKWMMSNKDPVVVLSANGHFLSGTYVNSTKQITTMLDSLGGVALFFPLLPQLDLLPSAAVEGAYAVELEFTNSCYDVISDSVQCNASSQMFMRDHNGFAIVAYLLQKASPQNLTPQLLDKVILMLENKSLPAELHQQLFKAFLWNTSLWVYCDASLQLRVYEYMLMALKTGENKDVTDMIRQKMGPKELCHIMHYYYSDMEVEISDELEDEKTIIRQWLALDEEFKHPITDVVVAKKVSAEEKAAIRTILFDIIEFLIQDTSLITSDFCIYISYSILWCNRNKDTSLLRSFLRLLDSVLHTDGVDEQFIVSMASFSHVSLDIDGITFNNRMITDDTMVNAGVLPLFFVLMKCGDKEIMTMALQLFIHIIEICHKSVNQSLWISLGVSRQNMHVVIDYVTSLCTADIVDAPTVRHILELIAGTDQLDQNDNLCIQLQTLIPLFFHLLSLLKDESILEYYNIFSSLFSNIAAPSNLVQLQNLPFWHDYVFTFVCHVRDEHPAIFDAVWGQVQTLLLAVVMTSVERHMYGDVTVATQSDDESVRLMCLVFSSIRQYIGVEWGDETKISKGLYAEFYVLIVNRLIAALSMPGDKTSFLVSIRPVIEYLYEQLVFMIELPENEDALEVERDHYNWQLISPFSILITSLLETLSRIRDETLKTSQLDAFRTHCFTVDLKLLLAMVQRYSLVINDHCEITDAAVGSILGDVSPTGNVPVGETASTGHDFIDDLLGGIAPTPITPSAIDLLGGAVPSSTAVASDLLGGIVPSSSFINPSDLLGGVTPPVDQTDMFIGMTVAGQTPDDAATSPDGFAFVASVIEEHFKPLYNEAVMVCHQIKMLVENDHFPRDDLEYLSCLQDVLRTITTESSLSIADDFNLVLNGIADKLAQLIEKRVVVIRDELNANKKKRTWFQSDKQKMQAARVEEILKAIDDIMKLPSPSWRERNTYIAMIINYIEIPRSASFLIDFTSIRTRVESSLLSSMYCINNASVVAVMEASIGYCLIQEKVYDIHNMKEGSHVWWRRRQIIAKKWSQLVESLVHERGPWGELKGTSGILTLTARTNSFGMHQIIVSDPEGSTHADASVWTEGETLETVKKESDVGKIASLMRSSVEEDLNGDHQKEIDSSQPRSRIQFSEDCLMVTPMLAVRGKLELSMDTVSFTVNSDFEREFKEQVEKQNKIMEKNKRIEGVNKYTMVSLPENKIWKFNELTHEEFRLYLFRQTALELFFQDSTSAFFSFSSASIRAQFHHILRGSNPVNLTPFIGETAEIRMQNDDSTQRWLRREMSTFEYLMKLNRLAGRSYNDISQYYIFPWVISDYSNPTIDLKNPAIYRNFDLPMGAQLQYRRTALAEKFEVMKDNFSHRDNGMDDHIGILCPPARFFSTHYSSSANVLWYLIRMEPYTSLHIFLQDGKYDRPDRQFWSIRNSYNGCTTNDGDVKELIPEFYYLPQFLKNSNKINLGIRQDSKTPISDVQLPPWAKSAEDFVHINREALEGEYVSSNLSKWIDLVFGYKQNGPEAERCYNVFSHISYYGALDMENLLKNYPADWQQAADMIENFGQTPCQLFRSAHAARKSLIPPPPLPLLSYRDWVTPHGCRYVGAMTCTKNGALPSQQLAVYKTNVRLTAPVLAAQSQRFTSSILTVGLDRSLAINPVKQRNGVSSPFDIAADSRLHTEGGLMLAEPFSPQMDMEKAGLQSDQLVAVFSTGLFMCVAGMWDNSLKVIHTQTGEVVLSIASGQEVISCVCISRDDSVVVTGSFDNSMVLYYMNFDSGVPRIVGKKTLFGHDGAVTCVAVNKELGLVCSGSRDGTIILYSLPDTTYLRTIYDVDYDKKLLSKPEISWCGITNDSTIAWYSQNDFRFRLYNITGEKLFEKEMNSQLNSITLSNDTQFVIAGGDKICVFMIRLCDFVTVMDSLDERYGGEGIPNHFVQIPNLHVVVRTIRMSCDEQFIFVGLDNGELCVVAIKA